MFSLTVNGRVLTDISRLRFTNTCRAFNELLTYCGENVIVEATYHSN